MIKLSQRGWNNVIIVSMLMLIMLFNFSSNLLNDGGDATSSLITLVPLNMTITTMKFEKRTVERVGQSWRTTPREYAEKYSHQELVSLIEHWSSAQINLLEQSPNWQSPTSIVKIWFAGQVLPIEYQFMQLGEKTFVKKDEQIYQLISPIYQLLILSE
jgi:hypothetical protein